MGQHSDFSGLQGSDIAAGLSLSLFNAGAGGSAGSTGAFAQNPQAFVLNFNAALGRFSVSNRNLLPLLAQNCNTAGGTAAPGSCDQTALIAAAERVNSSGQRLSEVMGKLVNDRKMVNPLLVGPSNNNARAMRSALSSYIKELQKVPVRSLTPEQLRAFNQVVDDTTLLAATLESVAPMLSDMSKRMNETMRR